MVIFFSVLVIAAALLVAAHPILRDPQKEIRRTWDLTIADLLRDIARPHEYAVSSKEWEDILPAIAAAERAAGDIMDNNSPIYQQLVADLEDARKDVEIKIEEAKAAEEQERLATKDDICPECGNKFAFVDDYLCPDCRAKT
jgi:hypothetical protein